MGITAPRRPMHRTYVMCAPTYFDVVYKINPWMDPDADVDSVRAMRQWEGLKTALKQAGHAVLELEAEPGLPDMVFAANGAFSVGGVAYGARFAFPQRAREAQLHADWYRRHGWNYVEPGYTNEGEGDFTYVPGRGLILAAHGFRTVEGAHRQAAEALNRPVLSLRLVDPLFYHLDTALFVLGDANICYFPGAFSQESQTELTRLFPGAVVATEQDAKAFGLNSVSDDVHVFMPVEATQLAGRLAEAGYTPVPIDLNELRKGGGSVKCCVAELRGND